MSKQENFSTGRKGEAIAAEYLKKKGYKIVARNWHTRFGEIDIIARDKATLVFVEVKTKIGDRFGSPEEMFDKNKMVKVQRMSMLYEPLLDISKRIDMVAVVLDYDDKVLRVDHYQGIY